MPLLFNLDAIVLRRGVAEWVASPTEKKKGKHILGSRHHPTVAVVAIVSNARQGM